MPYICAYCRVPWPCVVSKHDGEWSSKQWYPEGHSHSIACFVFDHEECKVPMWCKCQCHRESDLNEPSVTPSHQSLVEQ